MDKTYTASSQTRDEAHQESRSRIAKDPVCGMDLDPGQAATSEAHGGETYFFCCVSCAEKFRADPERYLMEEEFSAAIYNSFSVS